MYVGTKEIKKGWETLSWSQILYVNASPPTDVFANKISRLVTMHWRCSKNTQFKLTVKKLIILIFTLFLKVFKFGSNKIIRYWKVLLIIWQIKPN